MGIGRLSILIVWDGRGSAAYLPDRIAEHVSWLRRALFLLPYLYLYPTPLPRREKQPLPSCFTLSPEENQFFIKGLNPASLLIHWSTAGEFLNLSGPLFSYLINEDGNAGLKALL